MSNITSLLDTNPVHYDIFIKAGKAAKDQDLSCYLVGGYVRDKLLNRDSSDIDIMVEGDAISYAKILGRELGVPKIVEIDLDSDEIAMGIPCGGYMSVIVEPQMLNKTLFIRGMGSFTEILRKC